MKPRFGHRSNIMHIPVAPKWKIALARIFGKRYVIGEADGWLEYYVWRGHTYVTRFIQ